MSLRIHGKPPLKIYIAVFVCFTSKAVRLESDLSTDSFLLYFKRFAERRGLPREMYCNNAANFVGASPQGASTGRRLITSVVGSSFEESAEVEVMLNTRPIVSLSPDPNDGEKLTPAHLLIEGGLRSLAPEFVGAGLIRERKLWKRWRLLCGLKQTFWQAWTRDYIPGL